MILYHKLGNYLINLYVNINLIISVISSGIINLLCLLELLIDIY